MSACADLHTLQVHSLIAKILQYTIRPILRYFFAVNTDVYSWLHVFREYYSQKEISYLVYKVFNFFSVLLSSKQFIYSRCFQSHVLIQLSVTHTHTSQHIQVHSTKTPLNSFLFFLSFTPLWQTSIGNWFHMVHE